MSSTEPGRHGTSTDGAHAGGDPDEGRRPGDDAPTDRLGPTGPTGPGRREVVAEQKERFGGIKWGSAFFGWLTAAGTALLLTALAAAAGTAFGLATTTGDPGQVAGQAAQDPAAVQTAGLVSAIVVLVILLVSYYCGGYVAGRMARFNGVKQGVAVWLWAIAVAVVVAVVATVVSSEFNILANLNGLPRLPIGEGALTTAGILTAVVALAASLVGAVLGGLAGMRFHRKVDRAGFDH